MYSTSAGMSPIHSTIPHRQSVDRDCTGSPDPLQERPDEIHWANAEASLWTGLSGFCTGLAGAWGDFGVTQARSGRQTSRSPSSKGEWIQPPRTMSDLGKTLTVPGNIPAEEKKAHGAQGAENKQGASP